MFKWFLGKGAKQGIFWALMIYIVCPLNDVLMKILGERLHYVEISFFRFLFSSIMVTIPIMLTNKNLLKTDMHGMHIMRGALGAVAIALCCLSVNVLPMAENTTVLFSEALFMLPMAIVVLHEKVNAKSWLATVIGFAGLIVMFRPSLDNFNYLVFIPTVAAFLFAVMSIMTKIMVDKQENNLTMLFYFAIYTTLISVVFVPFVWVSPTLHEIYALILLGIGANLIQLFLFLAYRATNASTVSPIRYTELPFATLFGFILFGQIPDMTTITGAVLIVAGTFLNSYSENK